MPMTRAASAFELDANERLSLAELRALQLERLAGRLRTRTRTIPPTVPNSMRHGVRPEDLRSLADLARFPFTTKADLRAHYPFGFFAVPMDAGRAHPCLVRHDRQADRSRLHAATISAPGPDWSRVRSKRRAARPAMKVHVAYGYGLFTGGLGAHYGAEELGCTVIPMSGGQTERQVELILDFKPDIIMVTPSYMLACSTSSRARHRPAQHAPEDWHLRRRAVDRGDAPRNRGGFRDQRGRHLRPVGSDGPWRRAGICRDQGRTDHLGRPFLSRDRRSRDR